MIETEEKKEAPKKRKIRRRKRKSSKLYFGEEAQQDIELYISNLIGTPKTRFIGTLENRPMVGWFSTDSHFEGEFSGSLSGGVIGYIEETSISGSTIRPVNGYISASAFGPGINQTHLSGTFTGELSGSFEPQFCRELYGQSIRSAFETLTNSLIHTYKINFYGEDIYHMANACVSFLYATLHKYDPGKGSRAFSYFNMCAKNWLMQESGKLKKRRDREVDIGDVVYEAKLNEWDKPKYVQAVDYRLEQEEFIPVLMNEFERILEEEDLHEEEAELLRTIKLLFERADEIDTINRKVAYQLIREIGGFQSSEVTKRIRTLRERYREFSKKYNSGLI